MDSANTSTAPAKKTSKDDLRALFDQMEDIRSRTVLNPPGQIKLTMKQLIEEGRDLRELPTNAPSQ